MSSASTGQRVIRVLKYVFLALAIYFISAYVVLAVLRLRYPFELEWMEGGMVDQVRRILAGQMIYVQPHFDFVPFGYPALYFYLSALLAKVLGPGFVPLRLVSLLSSLGSLFLIFRIVSRETGDRFFGLAAAALFAATYNLSEAWFDIAKVDSLFLFLLLLGIYLLRFQDSRGGYAWAGIVLALSFFSKQTALVIAMPLLLGMAVLKKKRGLIPVGTMLALAAGGTLLLDWLHQGWYNYYIFQLPKMRLAVNFDPKRIPGFWTADIFGPFFPAILIAVFYLFCPHPGRKSQSLWFYLLAAVGMMGGAWFSRLETGAFHNVLFPAYAIIAILFGLGLHRLCEFCSEKFSAGKSGLGAAVYLLAGAQFVLLLYNPLALLPSRADLLAGRELIARMAAMNGEVLFFDHGFLPVMAGKSTHAQACAVNDIYRADRGPVGTALRAEVKRDLQARRFSFVILEHPHWFKKYLDEDYKVKEQIFRDKKVFWPVTGKRRKNRFLYVPR